MPPTGDELADVYAHLRARSRAGHPAGSLHTMTDERFRACIEALTADGHSITTVTVATGDRAANETGYVLRETNRVPLRDIGAAWHGDGPDPVKRVWHCVNCRSLYVMTPERASAEGCRCIDPTRPHAQGDTRSETDR